MPTIVRTIDAFRYCGYDGGWLPGSWDGTSSLYIDLYNHPSELYGAKKIINAVYRSPSNILGTVTSLSFSVAVSGGDAPDTITAYVFDNFDETYGISDPTDTRYADWLVASQTKNLTASTTSLTFSFSGLIVDASKTLYILLQCSSTGSLYSVAKVQETGTLSSSTTYASLSMSITPSSVGTGNPVSISFNNRMGQTLAVTYKKSSTPLYSETVTSDTTSITPTTAWFETAGETGTSMTVTVTATDGLSRTASGSFSLKKTAVISGLSPDNTSIIATDSMRYEWEVSGGTTQKSAEIYINGYLAGSVDGSTSYADLDYRPAPGTVSWYVRVTNNLGVTSQSPTATFTLSYSSVSELVPINSPTYGYILRDSANTFTVKMVADGTPYQDWTIAEGSPVFYWKRTGADTWTPVSMARLSDRKTAQVTIPAGTFPDFYFHWYAAAQDQQGNSRETNMFDLNGRAAPITATPVSPIDTIENANTPTVFTWNNSSAIQSTQAAAEVQWSTDGSTWTSFALVSGSAQRLEVAAADNPPSGTVWWRVRAQTTDGEWGSYSEKVSYINFGAPVTTNVLSDGKPLATITWETSLQQAYRLTVDGRTTYGPYFGPDVRSFQLPEYLADGEHTVEVTAQNEYSQWGQPSSVTFTVENVPGAEITLSGILARDAELSWAGGNTAEYLIYRDGVRIGKTSGYLFEDRTVLGWHKWQVINPLPGGYYSASNELQGVLITEALALAALDGGDWLDLTKSANSRRSLTYNLQQTVSIRQFAGQEWPEAEASPYKTLGVAFDVSWKTGEEEQAQIFAKMIGKPVIFKDPIEGSAFVGILSAWQRSSNLFYKSYSATVQRIQWRDYIDADA